MAASVLLHGALLFAIASVAVMDEKPARFRAGPLTDAPATTLTLIQPTESIPAAKPAPEPEPVAPVGVVSRPDPPAISVPPPPSEVLPESPLPKVVIATPMFAAPTPVPAPPVDVPPPPAPTASFAGVEAARAGRIVYVIDASAAMVATFPFLKAELLRSVERLEPTQQYQILAYRNLPAAGARLAQAQVRRASESGLVFATTRENRAAAIWLADLQPTGSSVPLLGLRAALELDPDLVFLLTTSIPRSQSPWGDGTPVTLQALDRLNPVDPRTGQRRSVIKTISFVHDDATGLLAAIAREHGDGEDSYRVLEQVSSSP